MSSDISTICCTGLPSMSEREFRAIFTFAEGVEDITLINKPAHCIGFVLFDTVANALYAIQILNGLEYEEGRAISCNIAKTQLGAKRNSHNSNAPNTTTNPTTASVQQQLAAYQNLGVTPAALAAYQQLAAANPLAAYQQLATGSPLNAYSQLGVAPFPFFQDPASQLLSSFQVGQDLGQQKCTLYVTGLPPDITEPELLSVTRNLPGYQTCKLINRPPANALAFIKFTDPEYASNARSVLHGDTIHTSDGAGILSVAFAKRELEGTHS